MTDVGEVSTIYRIFFVAMKRKFNMSNPIDDFFVLQAQIGDRLREARNRLALKQSDLADIGGISRATQVSYEAGTTEPTTAYLRQVQMSDIDIPYVLFGHSKNEAKEALNLGSSIDWSLLQQAYEHVDYFLMRRAPTCPGSYRWKMVSDVYAAIRQSQLDRQHDGRMDEFGPLSLIESIWALHEKRS